MISTGTAQQLAGSQGSWGRFLHRIREGGTFDMVTGEPNWDKIEEVTGHDYRPTSD